MAVKVGTIGGKVAKPALYVCTEYMAYSRTESDFSPYTGCRLRRECERFNQAGDCWGVGESTVAAGLILLRATIVWAKYAKPI